jgi:hypothetical protein
MNPRVSNWRLILSAAFGLLFSFATIAHAAGGSGGGGGGGGGGGTTTPPVVSTVPTITSFTANPTGVLPGGSSKLSWTASGVKSCSLSKSGVTGTITTSGAANDGTLSSSKSVTLNASSTFIVTCVNATGVSVSRFANVTVTIPEPVVTVPLTCTLTTDKAAYLTGESILFSWTGDKGLDFAEWKQPAAGIDTLVYPAGVLAAGGIQSILARVAGTHTATMLMKGNAAAALAECSRTVVVTDAISVGTVTDSRSVTPYPAIFGTAQYTKTVEISIIDAGGVEVYSTVGIPVSAVNAFASGFWKLDTETPFEIGTYTVKLYDEKHKFLDEGVLTIDPNLPLILRAGGQYGTSPPEGLCLFNKGAGQVNVSPSAYAQIIAIASYEPTAWTINLTRGSNVKKIIVGGYHPSLAKITGAPEYADVPIEYVTRYQYGKYSTGSDVFIDATDPSYMPTIWENNNLESVFGQPPKCGLYGGTVAPENRRYLAVANPNYFYAAIGFGGAEYNDMAAKLKVMTGLDIYPFFSNGSGTINFPGIFP